MQDSTSTGLSRGSCVLIFPPVWEVAAPYLAGPALAAYLRDAGYSVSLLDANLLFWRHFKSNAKALEIHGRCSAEADSPSLELDEGVAADRAARSDEASFAEWLLRVPLSSPLYKLVVRRFGGFWQPRPPDVSNTLDYHDQYFCDISHSFAAASSISLREQLLDERDGPWRQFARERVLPGIDEQRPALVGLSIVAANQVVPALAIALEARHAWPSMPIVIGGAWVTQLRHRLPSIPWLSQVVSALVPFQGEAALASLMAPRSGLPSHDESRSAAAPVPVFAGEHIRLAQLPSPGFDGLDLGGYAEPGHLPLMASRGCYWAKCRFCSYPQLEPQYEMRPKHLLARDLRRLVHEHAARHVAFADPSISVAVAGRIASVVEREELHVTWGGFARLEQGFTHEVLRRLAGSGCSVLHWGLESGSTRMQAQIGKGVDLDVASRVLEDAATLGIHNRLLMMYNLPQETEADLALTLEFVESHLDVIGSVCWSRFAGERGTVFGDAMAESEPLHCRDVDLRLGPRQSLSVPMSTLAKAERTMSVLVSRAARRSASSGRSMDVLKGADRVREPQR